MRIMKPLLLTVGNIYIDHNVFGVNAGETFTLDAGQDYFGTSGKRVLGGSAVNAAMQVARLGVEVGFVGKTGTDAGASEVRDLLTRERILADLISSDPEQTTSMAINLVDKTGKFIGVHYGGASKSLTPTDVNLNHPLFKRASGVYFGGTAKQPHLFPDCEQLFRELSSRGIRVFYDPNRFPAHEVLSDRSLLATQLAHVEGYFPNEEELLQATGQTQVDTALDFALESGVTFVALKRGAEGCRIKSKTIDIAVAGHKVAVVTTVGAGDCFNATFIASHLAGQSLQSCAERATAAAAIKVSRDIWPTEPDIQSFQGLAK